MLDLLAIIFAFIAATCLAYLLVDFLWRRYTALLDVEVKIHTRPSKARKDALGGMLDDSQVRNLVFCGLGAAGAVAGFFLHIGVLGIAVGAAAAGGVPALLMHLRAKARRAKVARQIVPMLNSLRNGLRSGKTLPQAIEGSANSLPRPISTELRNVHRQIALGVKPESALESFQNRVSFPEVRLAIRSMLVSIKTGSDLPMALELIGQTVTERQRVEGKIRTLTTQGRMQGIIMSATPFALLLGFYFMSPDYIGVMFHTMQGNVVLGVIIVLQIFAFIVINKIVSIRV